MDGGGRVAGTGVQLKPATVHGSVECVEFDKLSGSSNLFALQTMPVYFGASRVPWWLLDVGVKERKPASESGSAGAAMWLALVRFPLRGACPMPAAIGGWGVR
ncbi:uncharacterized protein TEOVI_000315900 [Trypanosoma equiperdum]|uniref:Uncharacterized protein n=1 Tax=Trypanosoma equiperdum TaxID=5694 RepID=A0A1G4IH74_TRYEQ|nr:hypothetical protein, conserved [Trypanosoma equiperdum]